jgi:hypothetical protein
LALAGVTWDDAIAELRVTLDDRSSPMPLPAQVRRPVELASLYDDLVRAGRNHRRTCCLPP